ncbi:MAG: hypothetical protein JWN71_166 [Xanthobacteraceae bacterium]|jgi:TPR repeat protein|nr:hypothetical protein [Xanthobacteraceae bacterium]
MRDSVTRIRSILLAATVLTAVATTPAHAKISKTYMVGNWMIGTVSDDASGQFTECVATTDYKNGFLLAFAVTKDLTWAAGFQNSRWQFAPQAPMNVAFKIDGGGVRQASGVAVARDLVRIPLPADEALFEEFRKGQMLVITSGGGASQFHLKTTSRMLVELLTCAKSNGGKAGAPVVSSAPAGGRGVEGSPAVPAQASTQTPAVIAQAQAPAATSDNRGIEVIGGAERRVALVIGNSAYKFAPVLANPKNDAADVAQSLRRLGFDVVEGHDLDRRGMEGAIKQFAEKIKTAKLAGFFYAGHGLQVDGKNYLVPTDAKLERAADLNTGAVGLDYVMEQMDTEQRTNLIFLDACRDNPLPQSINRTLDTRTASIGSGLAQIKGAIDTMIVFATQPDNVALDGTGRNSPFTTALLKHIPAPGVEISGVMKRVRSDVVEATQQKQIPWDHSSLRADVILASGPAATPSTPPPAGSPGNLAGALGRDGASTFSEGEALAAECDRAAADPYDTNKPANVRGVHRNIISRQAVQLCAKAVTNDEKNPRLNYQLGRALYTATDYTKARVFFQTAANLGYPQAMTELGRMSFFGHGTAQSYPAAQQQFEKAAALGDPSAIKNLGFMYHQGRGVTADVKRAISYYNQAPNHPTVLNNYALLYEKGEGVPKDIAKAVRMYDQAVLGGDETAMANLADLYERGVGVSKDLGKARVLYEMAATLGEQSAKQSLLRFR